MIALLEPGMERDFSLGCTRHPVTGPLIHTLWRCYGHSQPDVLLWTIYGEDGPVGAVSRCGGWMEICAGDGADPVELGEFLRAVGGCDHLHCPRFPADALYPPGDRESFAVMTLGPHAPTPRAEREPVWNPPLSDVYKVLLAGDPSVEQAGSWEAWYTHNSHLLRHGLGVVTALYRDEQPVCTAGVYSRSPVHDLISSVATVPGLRGQGLASSAVRSLIRHILKQGRTPALYCKEELTAFYEDLGFRTVDTLYRIHTA